MEALGDFFWRVVILAPPILMALTVHEAAHALAANLLGDPTARLLGRLSLNPLRHLDPLGTLVFFLTAWFGAGIGWARPVPVDARNLRDPRRAHQLIAAAGPLVNLLGALCLATLIHLLLAAGFFGERALWRWVVAQMLLTGVQVNLVLAFFNLIPLPPLDGSGILAGFLSFRAALAYERLSRYGFAIVLALMFLPGWLPGFPDVIQLLVTGPAGWLAELLLPR